MTLSTVPLALPKNGLEAAIWLATGLLFWSESGYLPETVTKKLLNRLDKLVEPYFQTEVDEPQEADLTPVEDGETAVERFTGGIAFFSEHGCINPGEGVALCMVLDSYTHRYFTEGHDDG